LSFTLGDEDSIKWSVAVGGVRQHVRRIREQLLHSACDRLPWQRAGTMATPVMLSTMNTKQDGAQTEGHSLRLTLTTTCGIMEIVRVGLLAVGGLDIVRRPV